MEEKEYTEFQNLTENSLSDTILEVVEGYEVEYVKEALQIVCRELNINLNENG